MAYLSPEEIYTHLYPEVINEISRTNVTLLNNSIDAAIAEARGYLTQYDIDTEFAKTGDDRNSILLVYLKDIAVWHFIVLSNPAVDMELRQIRYNNAIKALEKIQQGRFNPSLPTFNVTAPEQLENFFKWGSNKKRNDYFN